MYCNLTTGCSNNASWLVVYWTNMGFIAHHMMNIHQNKLKFGPIFFFYSRVTHLKNSVQNYFSTFSHHVMHHNLLPVNVRKCMTMSQPPGPLPAFINFKWLTQIIGVEVVWCEVHSHHPFCTMADSTGQKKRLYFFGHINLIMVSDSDGFIVVCFEIQILFALHTKPNDRRHKLIQRLGHVKLKHEKRKRK